MGARQPTAFFELARIDMDGTLIATDAECKQGIDIAYNGVWGYHPLVVSLANTGEVLSVFNRPGKRPSHEGAAAEVDRAMKVCLEGASKLVCVAPSCHMMGKEPSSAHSERVLHERALASMPASFW